MGSPSALDDVLQGAHRRILARSTAAPASNGDGRPCTTPGWVFRRLKAKYGLGDNADKRSALFEQLEKLHRLHPIEMEDLITEAVRAAASAAKPDRYFCVCVKKKILASGLSLTDEASSSW